ncbi:MAG: hypothetical protein RIQ68_2048, partial [Pseudomonadota bacterium]
GLFAGLVAINLAAWAWALISFYDHPVLLGTAFLAWVLGLRHAIDPDHIAAIDNVTRKLIQDGQQPISTGFWFALGHSTIVIIAAALLAASAAALKDDFEQFAEIGGIIGPAVSTLFLLLIGLFNLAVLVDVWAAFKRVRRTGHYSDEDTNTLLARRGFLARILRPLFAMISKPWHMYPLGFLFALGFDTATTISLFGVSAASTSHSISVWEIVSFPLLFTAGMVIADAADGVMMLGAYGWAFVKPVRKLFYNLVITSMSVLIAFVIGAVQALGLIAERLSLRGPFWDLVATANEEMAILGFVMIAIFAAAWGVSAYIYRRAGYDTLELKA